MKKVILIGIDGFDPVIMEKMMGEGKLPAFLKLAKEGCYAKLNTSIPPQSPVAWTSIATGKNPGEHGIFDFLHRDINTYLPFISLVKIGQVNMLKGFNYINPLQAETFWETASENRIKSTIIKWPLTFPPKKIYGKIFSGLGVPDIKGEQGRYSFYTTDKEKLTSEKKGQIYLVKDNKGVIETKIAGLVLITKKGTQEISLPLKIEINKELKQITIFAGNQKIILRKDEWSCWIELKFNLGFLRNKIALGKFYLSSIEPEFNLYLSPLHLSPFDIEYAVSYPDTYAEEIKQQIGNFATLGIAEDVNPLNDELINEDAFLKLCEDILLEREKMFFYELNNFKEGILACVFDTTDRIQHMFWRFIDTSHPMYDESLALKYGNIIYDYYIRMNDILAKVQEKVFADKETLLLICSDHGFNSFKKSVHLNSWLLKNGFLYLQNGKTSNAGLFKDVDWGKTKAYALGLNSLYINLSGREKNGIISKNELTIVKEELKTKLKNFTDNNVNVVKELYESNKIYSGKEMINAPDLIVGLNNGYRYSWQTAVGQIVNGNCIEDNLKKWSGDHCIDSSLVPGIFFSNQKVNILNPNITDIFVIIQDYLKLKKND